MKKLSLILTVFIGFSLFFTSNSEQSLNTDVSFTQHFQTELRKIIVFLKAKYESNYESEEDEAKEQEKKDVYLAWWTERYKDPALGYVPGNRMSAAIAKMDAMTSVSNRSNAEFLGLADINWIERGPNNVGGKVNDIVFDANDATGNTIFITTNGGGLWKCTNAMALNPVLTKVDEQNLPNRLCSIRQNPTQKNIWYLACYGYGGVWKSVNNGSTWTRMRDLPTYILYFARNGLAVTSQGTVFVSNGLLIYRSTDAGVNWATSLTTDPYREFGDIGYGGNGNLYCRSGNLIYTSSNNGLNWTGVAIPITPEGQITHFNTSKSNPNRAWFSALLYNPITQITVTLLFRTDDGGLTWPQIGTIDDGIAYAGSLGVSPLDENRMIVGGFGPNYSADGGNNFISLNYDHADQQAVAFSPVDINVLFIGNDGGLERHRITGNGTNEYISLDMNFNTTEFYTVDIHPVAGTNEFLAGSQDNGTFRVSGANIGIGTFVNGGDGTYCHYDKDDPTLNIVSYQNNNITIQRNGQYVIGIAVGGDPVAQTDYDDLNNILYCQTNGARYAYITNVNTSAPVVNYVDLPNPGGFSSSIRVSPNNLNTIYVGNYIGDLVKINNPTSPNPTFVTFPKPDLNTIQCIEVEKGNENHLLYIHTNWGVQNIHESLDGGQTWRGCDGNLPDLPVNWIVLDPSNGDRALIATELGIWATDNLDGANTIWMPANIGLPRNVAVTMLRFRESDRALVAATYGRGLFTTNYFSNTVNVCVPDVTAPSIVNCPANISLTTNTNSVTATWAAPTATDACTATTLTSNYNSGATFPLGITNVVYTARDVANNTAVCNFTVTVTQAITNTCVGNLVQNGGFESSFANWENPNGATIVTDAQAGTKAMSVCTQTTSRIYQTKAATAGTAYTFKAFCKVGGLAPGFIFIKYMNASFTPLQNDLQIIQGIGYNEASMTKTAPANTAFIEFGFLKDSGTGCLLADEACLTAGNVGNPCSPDVTAPILSGCPSNINLTTTTTNAIATWTPPTTTDACSATTLVSNYNSGVTFPIGSITVTYTAKDAANNTATCNFIVAVSQLSGGGCTNNLLTNNGFESSFSSWETPNGGTIVADAQAGTKAMSLCVASASRVYQFKTATTGTTYTFKSFAKKTGTAPTNIFIKFMNASFTPIQTDFQQVTSATYTEVTLSKLAPIGAAYMEIGFIKDSGTGCLLADEACLTTGGGTNPCSPDLTAPSIANCPANIALTTTGTTAIATWTAPIATDACTATTLTSNFNSGGSFPIGSTTVTYTARDVANNAATCNFTIAVTQGTSGACTGNLLTNNGFESSFANWENPNGATIVTDAQAGTKAMSLCVAGTGRVYQFKTAMAGTTYTFKAFCKKTGTAPTNIFIKFMNSGFSPIQTDFQQVTSTSYAEVTLSKLAPTGAAYLEVGFIKDTGIGCLLADEACLTTGGGGIPCFPDVLAPTISGCPSNISLTTNTISSTATWTAPTATDNCGTPTLASNFFSGQNFPIGSTTITYTAHDAANNAATCNFIVTVTQSGGGSGADLQVTSTADKTQVAQWNNVTYTFVAKNNGTATINAANIKIGSCNATGFQFFSNTFGLVYAGAPGQPTLGVYNSITQDWTLSNLAAGQSSTFTLALFSTLTGERKVVAFASSQSPTDPDSQPSATLANCTPMQDDEALWTINMGQTLLATGIRQQIAPLDAAQIADFQLFPNPAGEILNIDLTQWIGKTGKLIFINQLGKVVFEKTFENIQTPIESMDLSSFNNGQYFVKMETAGQRTQVKRLVVSRMY
jgi:hypothetical protein